jgi:hypothetical protein
MSDTGRLQLLLKVLILSTHDNGVYLARARDLTDDAFEISDAP